MDAAAALRRRASVRDDEMDDGPPALSCAWPEKSQRGVEPDGPGIQHQANRQNPRLQPADRGPEGLPRMIRAGRPIPGTHIRPCRTTRRSMCRDVHEEPIPSSLTAWKAGIYSNISRLLDARVRGH